MTAPHVNVPRAVLDTSVLVSKERHWLWTAAQRGLFQGVWSTYIVAELVRVRFRMTTERCIKKMSVEDCLRNGTYRQRIIDLIHQLSDALIVADYRAVFLGETLTDPDDDPVLAAALAIGAEYVVSLNTKDFPIAGAIMGVRYLRPPEFMDLLDALYPAVDVRALADNPGQRLP